MSQNRLTVSIHIPKTAGTTVAEVFSRTQHRRVIFDYDGYDNPFKPTELMKDNANFIESYFKVLHGHFYAMKYLELFPNAAFIATLRHPVDRVISQFMHEYNERSNDALFHTEIQNGKMSVIDFAEQPGIGDAISLHIAGRSPADYDLLIVSEQLLLSLSIYASLISNIDLETHYGKPVSLPTLNEGFSRSNRIEFDAKTREAIFDRTQSDNAVYSEALSLLNEKAKKLR